MRRGRSGGGGLADHPIVVAVGILAGLAAIVGFLIDRGVIPWPWSDNGSDAPDDAEQLPCADPSISLSRGATPWPSARATRRSVGH